ncbi:hypothetical protein GCM10010918_43110 [Paenibacillus radicis (ex Gao et al. 2016)]|uniref:ABC transporter permease n=1 Tax=Paenibacillus radicis (ex Gao et al. 2016) TaxID=1737354 RepID=A0A917HKM1_9BACL|nr:ABC transporter permease subunit [Paenibacillus radicis (ex Gao et al. 2016)]GGG81256.1 hypothetical protein GCM10010918_43110 [Paenibacillus radicis (ex Gao et al. 2016)]
MSQWMIIWRKELLELARSYKLLWLPLVFLLLGVSQPIVTYFLPDILANAGNFPQGTVIEMPKPQSGEVLAQTLQQYGMIGSLIVALGFMGAVSSERNSGAASMILVKPISRSAYLLAKWTAMLVLVWGSLTIGYLGAWYYTSLLIGEVDAIRAIQALLVFALWLSVIGTLMIAGSVWLRSGAAAAFSALGLAILLSLTASFLPSALAWSPGQLPGLASGFLLGSIPDAAGMIIIAGAVLTAAILYAAVWRMRRMELP